MTWMWGFVVRSPDEEWTVLPHKSDTKCFCSVFFVSYIILCAAKEQPNRLEHFTWSILMYTEHPVIIICLFLMDFLAVLKQISKFNDVTFTSSQYLVWVKSAKRHWWKYLRLDEFTCTINFVNWLLSVQLADILRKSNFLPSTMKLRI